MYPPAFFRALLGHDSVANCSTTVESSRVAYRKNKILCD